MSRLHINYNTNAAMMTQCHKKSTYFKSLYHYQYHIIISIGISKIILERSQTVRDIIDHNLYFVDGICIIFYFWKLRLVDGVVAGFHILTPLTLFSFILLGRDL